ncbi:MAG: PD-(D/E)XK nuclease family protein [Planctomycetota bacterium]|nr:PD-(D/E)XK nuclease family protein [Planctomycetota bacterium]
MLAERIRADHLARTTVLVPNGATAARVLELVLGAAGERAVVGLEVQTLEGFAERLAERGEPRPGVGLPAGSERLLVRELLGRPGVPEAYGKLRERPGFLAAVAAGLRDLLDAGLGPGDLPADGGTAARPGLAVLHRHHLERRAELGLDDDSARFAAAADLAATHGESLLVLFGVYDATGLQERLLQAALGAAAEALVLLPGHDFAGAFRGRLETKLGARFAALGTGADQPATSLAALRQAGVGGRVEAGTPLADDGSVEVLRLPGGVVGARLLARHVRDLLADSDLAPEELLLVHRGEGGVPAAALGLELAALGVPVALGGALADGPTGAAVLSLVRLLAADRVSRTRLLDTLALFDLGQAKDGLDTAWIARYERLTRDAGLRLVIGSDPPGSLSTDTRLALDGLRRQARRWTTKLAEDPVRYPEAAGLVAAAEQLGTRLKTLAGLHARLRGGLAWPELGRRLVELLDELGLGARPDGEAWKKQLAGLGALELFGESAEPAALVWFVEAVGGRPGAERPAGERGVTIAPLARNRGGHARRVVLLDGDEGSFPRLAPVEPLLGELEAGILAERGAKLELGDDAEERALFQELLDLAGEGLVLCTTTPGIEASAGATPSRYLLDVLGRLAGGRPPRLEDLTKQTVERVHDLDLAAVWTGDPSTARSAEEGLLFAAAGLEADPGHRLLAESRPGAGPRVALEVARAGAPGRTSFDGALAGTPALAEALVRGAFRGGDPSQDGVPTSASALESYATCGMRYFLQRQLGVGEHEAPEARRGIDVRDRGKIAHRILERFGLASESEGLLPWSGADPARLREVLGKAVEETMHAVREEAAPELRSLWDAEAVRFRGLFRRWLAQQINEPAGPSGTWKPLAFEWAFDGETYPLEAGSPLWLRGVVDRVDLAEGPDGTRSLRIVDYKTGSPKDYSDDSTAAGTRLQLHLYGAVARRSYGGAAGEGLYDFVLHGERTRWTGRDGIKKSSAGTKAVGDAAAAREVAALVQGMEAGHFGPLPRKDGRSESKVCDYCPVTEACGPWREAVREAAAEDDPVRDALFAAVEVSEEEL